MGKPPGPAPQLKHTIFHEPHATMTRRIGDAAGRGRRNSARGPKVVASRLCYGGGKYVRSPASRPPSRCAHPVVNIRTSEHHIPSRLSVRMFGSSGKKRANASSNYAAL